MQSQPGNNVLVVVLGGGRGARLDPLTRLRSKPAVPLAGKFRLIDVPISNAINSGLLRIFVLTQFNSVSLHRHIGETYQFDPFTRGFVQILAAQQTVSDERWYQGTADAVRQNLRFIEEMRGELVLVLSGDHIYRMDYREMIAAHLESGAEVTVAVRPCSDSEIAELGAVRLDDDGRIVEFREKPKDPAAREGLAASTALLRRYGFTESTPYLASMGIYLFQKRVLIELLDSPDVDFGRHILPSAARERRVHAYLFDKYWRDIGTIPSFFDAHLDLLKPVPAFDFYDSNWPFYTHPRYLPGARLTGTRFENAILAEGSVVESSLIEEAIVGIRARVRGATIRRSLIMGADPYYQDAGPEAPPVGIGEGSLVENAIVDKNARIGRGVRISNARGVKNADGPGWAIREGIVVISKNAVIPDGTEI
ncbi:MAG: sugar phosphate nucleotidyltransferase [Myxococcales bacterium]